MNTEIYGKVFVVQAMASNLKSAVTESTKPRVLNIGVPFADAPMPDGKYMVFPGMGTFGASKAGVRWIHEAMKLEMQELADFGYGHPGVTRTAITEMFHDDLS